MAEPWSSFRRPLIMAAIDPLHPPPCSLYKSTDCPRQAIPFASWPSIIPTPPPRRCLCFPRAEENERAEPQSWPSHPRSPRPNLPNNKPRPVITSRLQCVLPLRRLFRALVHRRGAHLLQLRQGFLASSDVAGGDAWLAGTTRCTSSSSTSSSSRARGIITRSPPPVRRRQLRPAVSSRRPPLGSR